MNVKRSSSSIAATRLVERVRVCLHGSAALLLERAQVGEGEDVRSRAAGAARLDLRALRLVLDRTPTASECRGRTARPAASVRVDRGADRADVREREVEERPLERVRRQDPEDVALPDPAGEQAVREELDALGRLGPGDLAPAVRQRRGRRAPVLRADGVPPEARDRALLRSSGDRL